jgi:hypothetical protein
VFTDHRAFQERGSHTIILCHRSTGTLTVDETIEKRPGQEAACSI